MKRILHNGKRKLFVLAVLILATTSVSLAQVPVLSEDFSSGTQPSGWTQESNFLATWIFDATGGFYQWNTIPSSPYSKPYCASLGTTWFTTNPYTNMLVTKKMDLSNFKNVELEFWHTQANTYGYTSELTVYYSTSSKNGPWTKLKDYNSSYNSWTKHTESIPDDSCTSTFFVAFEGGVVYYNGVQLDDISVKGTPKSGFDARMIDITSPVTWAAGSANTVTVVAANWAADSIVSGTYGYSLDGGTKYTQSATFDTLWPGNFDTFTFTQTITPSSGSHTLDVWFNNANGSTDDNTANDTMTWDFKTSLSDTVWIDPSGGGDYTAIQDAVDDLLAFGISGPTWVFIMPGTYSERIEIDDVIKGVDSSNQIVFEGDVSGGMSRDSVTISHNASGGYSVVYVDGADYITFRNMTIENTGTSTSFGFTFTGSADYNTINNVLIDMSAFSYYQCVGILTAGGEDIYSYGNNADYLMVNNSEIKDCYYGCRFNGEGTSSPDYGNSVYNTNITSYYYGIYSYYQNKRAFINNTFDISSSYAYGIYSYYGGSTNVEYNFVKRSRYGISLSYENYYYGDSSSIINNMVVGDLYGYRMGNTNIYHNTFKCVYYGWYCPYFTNGKVYNNIFDVTGVSYRAIYNYGGWSGKFSHNIFYYSGQTCYVNWTYYYNLDDALNALGIPAGSLYWNVNPQFVNVSSSPPDLHLNPNFQPYYGVLGLGVADDFDKDTRCLWGPTVGADESTYPVPPPTANFATEDTICYNLESLFQNVADPSEAKGHFWYLNGTFRTTNVHFSNTFKQRGYDTIKLVTYSCGGVDSITKQVFVDTPTVKTTPEFLANVNLIEASQTVSFVDLSSDCPNSWEWKVFPDSAYDPGIGMQMPSVIYDNSTAYSKNPNMIFMYPGTYDVCVWVDNGLGIDSICKKDYIIVKAAYNICDYAGPEVTQSGFGLIFDDGGASSDYSSNQTCDVLIEPCAKSMTLTFQEFDVQAGDFLRVYDDNGGNPLWDVAAMPSGLTGSTVTGLGKDSILFSPTGKLYIVWTTNNTNTGPGFKAEWSSVPDTFPDPTAYFEVQDTACVGEVVHFEGDVTGQNLIFEWDMDNDGFADQFIEDPDYVYLFAGSYPVKFSVSSTCNPNTARYTQDIVVIQPSVAPTPEFTANNRKPVVNKSAVTFEDMSMGCADNWVWKITPSTFTDVSGFPNTQMPVIKFNDTGCYDVTLYAYYQGNMDSIHKPCYIQPMIYCDPAVINTNPDVGISRVAIGSIDNRTTTGVDKYTSYLATHSTNLELSAKYAITIERATAINHAGRKVWIDWNIDGDFDDAGELVIHEKNAQTIAYHDTITVPSTAAIGNSIMRVAISHGTSKSSPCGPVIFGEIEDYEVVISPDRTPPVITLNGMETIVLNQCDPYLDAGATAVDNINGNVTSSITTTNNLITSIPGTYTYRYNVSDAAGNDAIEVVRTIVVNPDTLGPEVMVLGDLIDSVEVYNAWSDTGYTVNQRCVTIVSQSTSGTVDTSMVGEYEITYSATDSLGNVTEAVRIVRVVDLTDPVIGLLGNAVDSVEVFSAYTDPWVDVTDNYYSNLAATATVTGTVNTNVVGDYQLEYSVTDGSGNGPVTVTRTVKVVDTEAPMVKSFVYKDGQDITLDVFDIFATPIFDISDNYYEGSTLTVTEGGTFVSNFFPSGEATMLGDYVYTYSVEDGSGNVTVFTLNIEVVDREAPVIVLEGSPLVTICRFKEVDDDVTVTDNYDQSVTVKMEGTYLTYLQDYAPGLYYIVYSAEDASGNKSNTINRYVEVLDTDEGNCVTGVKENEIAKAVRVYPNPSKGQLNVSVSLDQSRDISIIVTNALGQVVYETVEYNVSTQVINLNLNLSNGMYNVKVQANDGSALFPIVIAK